MKRSTILCASVVALVAFAISAGSAFAGANDPIGGVGVVLGNNKTKPQMGVAPSSGGPKNTTSSGGPKNTTSSGGPKPQVLNPAGSGGARTK
jgi:hypothetical protein